MRQPSHRVGTAVPIGIVAQPGHATAATTATSTYALTVLPTLGAPFDANNAAGINDRGWIVVDANTAGSTSMANAHEHATLWRHEVIIDLGTLAGPSSSIGSVDRAHTPPAHPLVGFNNPDPAPDRGGLHK